jgi:hypothetical protein
LIPTLKAKKINATPRTQLAIATARRIFPRPLLADPVLIKTSDSIGYRYYPSKFYTPAIEIYAISEAQSYCCAAGTEIREDR